MGSIKLNISVRDIATVMTSFDVIRVKRSINGVGGDYNLITANAAAPATLTASAGNYDVNGLDFQFLLDSQPEIDVTFSGVGPLTAAQVASQINAVVGDAVASDSDGTLVLTSTINGTSSKLEITGGGALTELGLAESDRDIGEDAHIILQVGRSLYDYTDDDGEAGYYYRVQYYNTVNGLTSADSEPFEGVAGTLVGSDKLSIATVDLVDARGVAVVGQTITFYSVHEPLEVEGFQVALTRAPITIETDNSGHAEVALVRGLKVRAVFDGTSIIRDFEVPDVDTFDLLTVLGSSPDPFSIVNPQFNYALRRTV